ncbi:TPA: hypothetical protein EYP38_02815, partial [Candidatus Micrarchaeota archaeon]|nr:hypothetical protein [Candidatus Micrarchaeota archaeon]
MRGIASALSDFEYAEVRIDNGEEKTVKIINNEVKVNSGSYSGISVRVLENGSWGFAASNTGQDVKALLKRARKLAGLEKGKISVRRGRRMKKTVRDRISSTSQEDIVEKLLEGRKHMEGKEIISKALSCVDSVVEKEFYNSEGVETFQRIGHT